MRQIYWNLRQKYLHTSLVSIFCKRKLEQRRECEYIKNRSTQTFNIRTTRTFNRNKSLKLNDLNRCLNKQKYVYSHAYIHTTKQFEEKPREWLSSHHIMLYVSCATELSAEELYLVTKIVRISCHTGAVKLIMTAGYVITLQPTPV